MNTNSYKLNQEQKDFLIGTLLGDGNFSTGTQGRTWRYRVLHGGKNSEIDVKHKYQILQDFVKTPPKATTIIDSRTNHSSIRWSFNTTVNDCFRFYGNLFYKPGQVRGISRVHRTRFINTMVKDVPNTIEKFLTPRAIAYWFMDDGAAKHAGVEKGLRLCTESFRTEGVNKLKNALKNLYDIETTLVKKKKDDGSFVGYRLYVSAKSGDAFRKLIAPYILPEFRYKLE